MRRIDGGSVWRLWDKIDVRGDLECWPWKGGTRDGYGLFKVGRRSKNATHVVFAIDRGRPVPSGLILMHSCDNRGCCNPSHLSLGTRLENNRDRDRKGRQVSLTGERHGRSKLTHGDVLAIRNLHASGVQGAHLASRFGVSASTISSVALRKTWRHV